MGVTYTRGLDLRRRRLRTVAATRGEWLLALTSAVVTLAIGLAYGGRTSADAWANGGQPSPINLNVVERANAIEPALAAVFSLPADRRFAARIVAGYLRPETGQREIANVGALSRIEVTAAQIDRERGVVVFRERLEALRRNAAEARRAPAVSMPLFTAADVAALKPALAVRTPAEFASTVMLCSAALILSFPVVSIVWRWRGIAGDRILLALAQLLVGIGAALILSRPDPLRDTLLLARYTEGVVVGVALFALVSMIDVERAAFRELSYVPLLGALMLSVVLIVFGTGPGTSHAKVNLGPVQPIEAIRLLLGLFLAGYFARRWELLRQIGRLDHVLPVAAGVGAALLLFFFQKDLGPALLLSLMFLAMFAIARGSVWLAGAGLATMVGGVAIGQWLNVSRTLAARVEMWQSPWVNLVRGGDQVAQAMWGLAAGAVSGTGLGLGHTRVVPESHTDLMLAAVGEELGLAGLLTVGIVFALIAWRGLTIARRASSDYAFFLALAMTLSLTIPVAVMAAGILGVLPLTGVVTPFVSYGGSAMVANFVALGLLAAIGADRRPAADLAPFTLPTRWLGRVGLTAAAMLVVAAASVQTLKADEYLVRPQLGVQADGGRRFQYNPRVLDAVAAIPRGSIVDRRGDPLAEACPGSSARCYPGGAAFFHVLGDANTRANWSAANSSYVERDAEALLRGFDVHATTITTTDRDGRTSAAIRRDYTAIVPLVRHRYDPNHPDVQAILTRPRDVRITIDAQLQQAAASILAKTAKTAGAGRGAAVVLDAATGEVLASASSPWPEAGTEVGTGVGTDPLLDRARYGLYPPGSTFKIITAAAALRQDSGASQQAFVCQRLPSNRVGIRLRGFGPPIHDDVKDAHPHGRIAMHDAVVKSCNAYFAQLAVAIGPDALGRTAAAAGITLNSSRSAERIRANLPHAGYGQGEVMLTPLRLARVSAALGTDGTIREAAVFGRAFDRSTAGEPVLPSPAVIKTPFVSHAAAQTLAAYLRDAVQSGTGRLLMQHPARIAGKTGTAEVDEEAPHAWFTGFAPHGPATRRIAFAVVLEHAGYGGGAAANAAGQIVTAAAALGLVK